MRHHRLFAAAALILPLLASIAAPARAIAQDSTQKAADAVKPKRRNNVISEEEIAALGGSIQTALGIVQRLRPAMLRSHAGSIASQSDGSSSAGATLLEVQVYLDNQKMGGTNALADITLAQIREIRYLNASDATTLFGTGNTAGAIQVIGKR